MDNLKKNDSSDQRKNDKMIEYTNHKLKDNSNILMFHNRFFHLNFKSVCKIYAIDIISSSSYATIQKR